MMKAYLICLCCYYVVACQPSANPKEGTSNSVKDSFPMSAVYTFQVNIDHNTWKGKLFYSKPANADSVYFLDSVITLNATNPSLSKIFTNLNEDFFTYPLLTPQMRNQLQNTSVNKLWFSTSFDHPAFVTTQDVNFDGHTDLLLYNRLLSGATNRFYDIWIFDNKKDDYVFWHMSHRLGLWSINNGKRELTFGLKTGSKVKIETYHILHDTTAQLIPSLE